MQDTPFQASVWVTGAPTAVIDWFGPGTRVGYGKVVREYVGSSTWLAERGEPGTEPNLKRPNTLASPTYRVQPHFI